MPKAIQGIKSLVDVTPEQLEDVRSAFAAANIEITVLSCYQDLSNPNAEVRRSAVSSVFSALKCQVSTRRWGRLAVRVPAVIFPLREKGGYPTAADRQHPAYC